MDRLSLTAIATECLPSPHNRGNERAGYALAVMSGRDCWRSDMRRTLVRFLSDQSGATAIEYGLIAAGIAVAIIAVVQGLGTNLKGTFSSVSSALK